MLKRRSTLDTTEKARRNRHTEYCFDLDKCLQIPNDQRLLLRRQIKDNHPELTALFDNYRRDRNLADLQMKLRRFLQKGHRQPTQTSERKHTQPAQRIYSQHSQNGSFKNSAKCSPEKEEPKRKTITFDISQLQKKVEIVERHREIGKIGRDGSASQRELSLSKEKKVVPVLNSCSSTKSSLKMEADLSKVTLRNKEVAHEKKMPLEDVSNSMSYSSSIRNMLICKLKEKDQPRDNRIVLKPRVNKELKQMDNTILEKSVMEKSIIERSIMEKSVEKKVKEEGKQELVVRWEKEAVKRDIVEDKPSRRDTIRQDKLQSVLTSSLKDTESTVTKKAPKPIQRDQMQCSVRLFDESMPMYLKSSPIEDSLFTNRRPQPPARLQTQEQDDSPKFGQFYKRIRSIIESDCC